MLEKVAKLLERKDVEEKVIISLKKTKETRKEHAFGFFHSNGELITGDIIEGEKHLVSPSKIEKHFVGSFHTHPTLVSGDIYPSLNDVGKHIFTMDFFLVGGNKKKLGIVRCFDSEDLLDEFMNIMKSQEWENQLGEKINFEIIEDYVAHRKKMFDKIDGLEFPREIEFEQKENEEIAGVDLSKEKLAKEMEKFYIILALLINRMLKDDVYLDKHSHKKTYLLR